MRMIAAAILLCILIYEILVEFRRFDVVVDNEIIFCCQYKLFRFSREVMIWDDELSFFNRCYIRYSRFGIINSYWIWNKRSDEELEKIKNKLKDEILIDEME